MATAVLALAGAGAAGPADMRHKIEHVIVIYNENWSFDGLYSTYPGANGANGVAGPQLQCPVGTATNAPLPGNPPALIVAGAPAGPWPCGWSGLAGGTQDPFVPLGMPMKPYALASYEPPNTLTGDLWHVFWHEQLQIDTGTLEPSNGHMDKFAEYSSNPGLTMSYYDATNMPEGKIAQHYTMADDTFHSAFGGSFLNHFWLISAQTPQWRQPLPTSNTTTFESYWDPATKTLNDKSLSTMPLPQTTAGPLAGVQYYVVNTALTVDAPVPSSAKPDQLMQPIPPAQKTIGDLLTDHSPSLSWKWYAGGWDGALAGSPDVLKCVVPSAADPRPAQPAGDCFQYHHQPFNYYQRWGADPVAKAAHLQDEQRYFADLAAGTLPAVSFIKPVGIDNDHPNYAQLLRGQEHTAALIAALCKSKYWQNTAVFITYDENGGRWDHVTPPKIDQWGPGTRVPMIVVSPYARAHFVDHTQYETVSILAYIEKLFGLPALASRDAQANPFEGAFDYTQAPLRCQSS